MLAVAFALGVQKSNAQAVQRAETVERSSYQQGHFPALVSGETEVGESKLDHGQERKTSLLAAPLMTTLFSLTVVLAIFAGLVWAARTYGGDRSMAGTLPTDVLENLGSSTLDAKTRVTLLRLGDRIVVVGQSQNGDPQTLTEIVDPEEVERLTNRCKGRPQIIGRRASRADADGLQRPDRAVG